MVMMGFFLGLFFSFYSYNFNLLPFLSSNFFLELGFSQGTENHVDLNSRSMDFVGDCSVIL